ncbi:MULTISPECIES: LysR family transcriptional regulator [unclassified Burkholderia]|uniref:LysR family transcriptional regulator n=1 Tax=unclassified Burkholderia TaxID=2613784 RepID=UPI0021505627|nr:MULTISPECIES: LysR family transcriptional regulator [unclassified Burkholderia]MCR4471559.1 LysR family transcriptional regulator [Burkholderia sp. SCN-KJ]
MNHFDWDNLRIFLAAARSQSALEASHTLKMSQSTISRRIQRLERDTGSKLFDRSSQGLRLTSAGHRLLEHVEKLESTITAVESSMLSDTVALTGEIRLGATEGFGTFFLTPHLTHFCTRHPAITVDILPLPRTLNLSKREADASVAIDRPSANSFVTCKLSEYRMLPYATPEYLDKHPSIRKINDLVDHRWIDYVDDLIFSPQQFSLPKWLPALKPCLRSTSVIAQAQAVKAGLGIGVLPCFLGSVIGNIIPVLPDAVNITRTFWLVAPPERRELARVRALWDYIREVAEANEDFLMGRTTQSVSVE